jgi:hypothetical protein
MDDAVSETPPVNDPQVDPFPEELQAALGSPVSFGAAPNPLMALAEILTALKSRDGHLLIPGFYDDVIQRLTSLPALPAGAILPRSRHGVLFVEVGKPWPYRIFIRRRGEILEVIAFAHHHRADDHWAR